jgi:mRNA interferase RelE/StbE
MNYELRFTKSARKEWNKLDWTIQEQFLNKLEERIKNPPHVKSAAMRNLPNHYKIKLRAIGYRLVYEVIDSEIVILIVKIGRRDQIYIDMQ